MSDGIANVGSQDLALRNSPVAEEESVETQFLRQEAPGDPVCYFNDVAFEHGAVVKSGSVLLRCDRGLWVEAGSASDTM